MTINWRASYVVKHIPKYDCVTAMFRRESDQTLTEPAFVSELNLHCKNFKRYTWFCERGSAFYPAFNNDGGGGAYIVRERPRTEEAFLLMAGKVAVRDSFLKAGKQLPDCLKYLDAVELKGDSFDTEVERRHSLGMPLSCCYEFCNGARSRTSVYKVEKTLFEDELDEMPLETVGHVELTV